MVDSTDEYGFADSVRVPQPNNKFINLYDYADNNPTNLVDPDGKSPGKIMCFAECSLVCEPVEFPVKIACEKACEEACGDPLSCNISNFQSGDECYSCQECPGQSTPICEKIQCQNPAPPGQCKGTS